MLEGGGFRFLLPVGGEGLKQSSRSRADCPSAGRSSVERRLIFLVEWLAMGRFLLGAVWRVAEGLLGVLRSGSKGLGVEAPLKPKPGCETHGKLDSCIEGLVTCDAPTKPGWPVLRMGTD